MRKKISRVTAAMMVLGVAPIMAAASVAGPTSAGASSPTRLLTCTGKLTSKPATYLLSCADAGAGWDTMTWSAWGASSATGHGVLRQNNCTPNCADGKFISYYASVTLTDVISTKKYGELFSKAIFHYRVNGKPKSETFGLAD